MTELYEEIFKLRIVENKYQILINLIKDEAKGIYFDKEKILKYIDILEETKQKENGTN